MPANKDFTPHVEDKPTKGQLAELNSAFPSFSPEELSQDWAKEYKIALSFGLDLDLYRAITGFKRALILLPKTNVERRKQTQYALILSYYLGHKFPEVVLEFEASDLVTAKADFPAFQSLLLLLTDTYERLQDETQAKKLRALLEKFNPELAERLEISAALRKGDLDTLQRVAGSDSIIKQNLDTYHARKKDPGRAKALQAILPGAGYYYVGQKRAAFTSFCINALFGWATYKLIAEDQLAAGIIVGSLEVGWYVGGINGAGMEAVEYNERTYEPLAGRVLREGHFFPVMMFETVF